jgi:hypothetical protein
MRITKFCFFVWIVVALCVVGTSTAQSRIDLGIGGGFSEPQGRAGINLNNGWNFDVRGGYKVIHASRDSFQGAEVALDLDFNYNRWNLNQAALNKYGEPGGYMTMWSMSFTPAIYGSPHWHISPYLFGGPGVYYRNLSLTQPALINTFACDPFFGFCYQATVGVNQVVASSTTYKLGANVGAGLQFPLGHSPLKVFGEARYSRMFTTHGSDLTFIPVTFGLRW